MHVPKLVEPLGASKHHSDIFIALSKILKAPIKKPSEAEIEKAMKAKTKISFRPFVKREGFDISPKEFIDDINTSVLRSRRLSWLLELKVSRETAA
jgi:hypothetical protein